MRRFISYFLLFVTGLLLLIFLVANRQPVKISMDPVNTADPAFYIGPMPMFWALVVTLTVGFIMGLIAMWMSHGKTRQQARERKAEIRRLEQQLELAAGAPPPKRPGLPALRG